MLGVLKTVPSRKGFTGHACGRKGLPSTLSGLPVCFPTCRKCATAPEFRIVDAFAVTADCLLLHGSLQGMSQGHRLTLTRPASVNAHVMHAVTTGHSQTHQLSHLQWFLYFCRQRCRYTVLSAEACVLSRHLPTDQCMRNIVTAYPIARNCNMPVNAGPGMLVKRISRSCLTC